MARSMTLRNQVLIWAGFPRCAILLLWLFRSILLPFVVGLALAYLLNPLVNMLQQMRHQSAVGVDARADVGVSR